MKAKSYVKFTNTSSLVQPYFDSIDLPKILIDRENIGNCKLQKTQFHRRHHLINWRWQSRLLNWF